MGEAVRDTVDRCERLIASLLLLARSEAATGQEEPVDVAALAADCITDLWARAEEAQIEIRDDLEPAWTTGHPGLLERLIANLVDNGIHHNVPGGFLQVQTRASRRPGRAGGAPTAASRSTRRRRARADRSRSGAWTARCAASGSGSPSCGRSPRPTTARPR